MTHFNSWRSKQKLCVQAYALSVTLRCTKLIFLHRNILHKARAAIYWCLKLHLSFIRPNPTTQQTLHDPPSSRSTWWAGPRRACLGWWQQTGTANSPTAPANGSDSSVQGQQEQVLHYDISCDHLTKQSFTISDGHLLPV